MGVTLRAFSSSTLALALATGGFVAAACGSASSPAAATGGDSGADVGSAADTSADAATPACSYPASAPPLLPNPSGSYGVGRSARRTLVDPVRDEPETPDPTDKRKLSIEIWYPTDLCQTTGTDVPYLDAAEANIFA
jgi:hypothetical protein